MFAWAVADHGNDMTVMDNGNFAWESPVSSCRRMRQAAWWKGACFKSGLSNQAVIEGVRCRPLATLFRPGREACVERPSERKTGGERKKSPRYRNRQGRESLSVGGIAGDRQTLQVHRTPVADHFLQPTEPRRSPPGLPSPPHPRLEQVSPTVPTCSLPPFHCSLSPPLR